MQAHVHDLVIILFASSRLAVALHDAVPAVRERSEALASTLPHLPRQACWRLYCHVPGLLHFMTAEVARRLRALGHLLGLPYETLVELVRCGVQYHALVGCAANNSAA